MKVIYLICVLCFIGCTPLEFGRLLGTSTRPFTTKGTTHTATINNNFDSCYISIKNFFNETGAVIIRDDYISGYIIANNFTQLFPQAIDATEIAVFLSEPSDTTTIVKISSLNHNLSDYIAEKILKILKNETD